MEKGGKNENIVASPESVFMEPLITTSKVDNYFMPAYFSHHYLSLYMLE